LDAAGKPVWIRRSASEIEERNDKQNKLKRLRTPTRPSLRIALRSRSNNRKPEYTYGQTRGLSNLEMKLAIIGVLLIIKAIKTSWAFTSTPYMMKKDPNSPIL